MSLKIKIAKQGFNFVISVNRKCQILLQSQNVTQIFQTLEKIITPRTQGRKLNDNNTFRGRPGSLMNVLCTSNLHHVSRE